MPDREKIVEALDCCTTSEDCLHCPYDEYHGQGCFQKLMVDALALLKEQEAVEPKVEKAILDYQSWHYICGDCGGQIDINDNYCRHCGRVVAHLSNKI